MLMWNTNELLLKHWLTIYLKKVFIGKEKKTINVFDSFFLSIYIYIYIYY